MYAISWFIFFSIVNIVFIINSHCLPCILVNKDYYYYMQKISKVRHNSKSTEDAVLLEVLRQRKHRQYSVPTDSNTVNSAAEKWIINNSDGLARFNSVNQGTSTQLHAVGWLYIISNSAGRYMTKNWRRGLLTTLQTQLPSHPPCRTAANTSTATYTHVLSITR